MKLHSTRTASRTRIGWALCFMLMGLWIAPSRLCAAETGTHHSGTPGGLGAGGRFGLGIVLGEPSGLSAKYWLRSHDAVDFGLAYSFDSFFAVFSDYLYHFVGALSGQKTPLSQMTPYIGIGAILLTDTAASHSNTHFFTANGSSVGLGLRLPLGMEWRPIHPLGIFLELVPGLGIIPSTFGFFEAGIGARFYF